ncbi:hypothetical protein SAMD00019534_100960 [Acytostelium subglobosum LB1]|uniref:hypothetical protein n=1 Tax=Acytostelium subglobosum LB1 TaxID=1410327 RepID=UPI000644913B|nr:hypothetical protein SAMD00019534_100960 [Acytostelium subglobosum LB1]GAM26921.1 hypothetical protein SAMD00019534_100960 [Acytostelium subglobosum LB1]|eukprot:XP_012750189.1 hypothetical protein SAMD00019534_100960 [Acytostelium subglobosum LB1]
MFLTRNAKQYINNSQQYAQRYFIVPQQQQQLTGLLLQQQIYSYSTSTTSTTTTTDKPKITRSSRGVGVKSSGAIPKRRVSLSSAKALMEKRQQAQQQQQQQDQQQGQDDSTPKLLKTPTTSSSSVAKRKETPKQQMDRLEKEIEKQLISRKNLLKDSNTLRTQTPGEAEDETEVPIGLEDKESIDKEYRRQFWAAQMTMRESLKKDGGRYLFDQSAYKDTEKGYNMLAKKLMDAKSRERAQLLEAKKEKHMQIMMSRQQQQQGKWANLPSIDEYDMEEEDEEDLEDYNDGLPDLTRLEVETDVAPSVEAIEGIIQMEKEKLLAEAKENVDEDDFDLQRKLKRIEFMSKKKELQEKQRIERMARLGIVEEDMVEIDPQHFKRFQDGEITEEEMTALSRKFVQDEEDVEEQEGGDYEEGPDYDYLKHWKIGSIEVPKLLKRKISQALKGFPTAELRQISAELSDSLRTRTRSDKKLQDKTMPYKVAPEEKPVISYGKGEALAYIAHRMPGVYACTHRVFSEIATRLPNFKPTTLLDYGSGPGTVIWSARQVWGESLKSIRAVEPSTFMSDISKKMLEGNTNEIKWSQFLMQPPHLSESMQSDLVVASYVLSELPDQETREKVINDLWRNVKPTGMLVLVEPGTPIGFSLIRAMRQMLLDLPADQVTPQKSYRAQVVAPCPHSGRCPMGFNSWCHFSQRVARPVFQKLAKGPKSTVPFEDEKYSYIVMSKLIDSTIPNQMTKQVEMYGEEELKPNKLWSRLNEAPFKRKGHVTMDVCTPAGDLKRVTIAKSHGKQLYKEARRTFWSDGLIIDESAVDWIPSRNQIIESAAEIEFEKYANIEKMRRLNSPTFKKSQTQGELQKVIEHMETTPRDKKRKQVEKTREEDKAKMKKQEWVEDLAQDDRKMLEKLVREGKFSMGQGLFGEKQRPHQDYMDMGNDDDIGFEDQRERLKKKAIEETKEELPMRHSSKSMKAIKQRMEEDIEMFASQNVSDEIVEQSKQQKQKQQEINAKKYIKKGTLEAFLQEETTGEGADLSTKKLETEIERRRRAQQAKMSQLVENVRGMGINTKDNRGKRQNEPPKDIKQD